MPGQLPAILLIASILLGLAFVIAMVLWLRPNTREVPLSRRRPTQPQGRTALAGVADAATRGVERLLAHRTLTLADRLDVAGISTSPAQLIVLAICAQLVALALGFLFRAPTAGILLAVLIPIGISGTIAVKTGRRQSAFALQLDETAQMLAGSLRAGYSFTQAMNMVGRESEPPTSDEFTRITNELRVGRPIAEAMSQTADRMKSEDFAWISQAVAINREVGGNLADVLDGVAHTIRERTQLRRQVASLSAEGKLSAIVLIALPFGIVGLLSVANPTYLALLFTHPVGWGMIGLAVFLLVVGGLWLRKTVQIKF